MSSESSEKGHVCLSVILMSTNIVLLFKNFRRNSNHRSGLEVVKGVGGRREFFEH